MVSIFILLIATPLFAAVDLKEAIQRSILNSPVIKVKEGGLKTTELESATARSQWLPSLDLSAKHGVSKYHRPSPTAPWESEVGLTLTENLYDNGKTLNQSRVANLKVDNAKLELEREKADLTRKVVSEFYRYSLAMKLGTTREEQFSLLKIQYENIANQYRQGMRTRNDYLRFKNQLLRAEIETNSAKLSREKSELELHRLIALREEEKLEFQPIEPFAHLEPESPNRLDPKGTYDFKLSEIEIRIKEVEVRLAEREYWPGLFVSVGAGYNNSGYLGGNGGFGQNEQFGANALLGIKFNLWDWGIRRRDIEIADTKKNMAAQTSQDILLKARALVRSLETSVETARKNLLLTTQLLKAEEENYNSISTQYREGKLAYLDLITSLNDFLDAKLRHYAASFGLAEDLASIHFNQGNIYEFYTGT